MIRAKAESKSAIKMNLRYVVRLFVSCSRRSYGCGSTLRVRTYFAKNFRASRLSKIALCWSAALSVVPRSECAFRINLAISAVVPSICGLSTRSSNRAEAWASTRSRYSRCSGARAGVTLDLTKRTPHDSSVMIIAISGVASTSSTAPARNSSNHDRKGATLTGAPPAYRDRNGTGPKRTLLA